MIGPSVKSARITMIKTDKWIIVLVNSLILELTTGSIIELSNGWAMILKSPDKIQGSSEIELRRE